MEAAEKPLLVDSLDQEAERIRNIFSTSFPHSSDDLNRLIPENFTDTLSRRSEPTPKAETDEFDWSITLANIEAIVDASNASKSSVADAERRAEIAEAKAREAIHWLRLLHEAVLKGMPAPSV
ncbi:hypothetical protein ASG63_22695 [Methylobacterium sp. Leaf94]|uniref:hypothetical protein n=1 Tax=Methylobacterium sp. Leaf94 TaxID=1736250 RepID=UPI0006F90310|nr:hypothetical protein [Methylobacterium sp. Leaf94]KQU22087.1 hypothetical protein ASG63_22695 [Methylobacterium sp. Leaf94]